MAVDGVVFVVLVVLVCACSCAVINKFSSDTSGDDLDFR